MTWLKDNKPLDDRLADRIKKTELANNTHKLELQHCSEDDSGLYTARANNGAESATCSAQLIVQKSKLWEGEAKTVAKCADLPISCRNCADVPIFGSFCKFRD